MVPKDARIISADKQIKQLLARRIGRSAEYLFITEKGTSCGMSHYSSVVIDCGDQYFLPEQPLFVVGFKNYPPILFFLLGFSKIPRHRTPSTEKNEGMQL